MPETSYILLTAAALFVAAYTQGVTGFGFGLVAMALLPLFGPARDASVLVGIFSLLSSVAVFWSVRSCFRWRDMVFPLVGMAVGVPLGVYALTVLDEQAIRKLVAIVVLLAAVQTAAPRLLARRPSLHPGWGVLAGVVGGVLGGAFGIGGPPVIIYASVQDWEASRYKAMLCSYFTCANVYRVILLAGAGLVTRPIVVLGVASLPAMLLGTLVGIVTYKRLSADTFRKVIVVTLILLALTLLLS
ncbi:MAG: sulfite exporter TauE/SafE family protein [Anaerolineae bacterium]